MWKDIKPVPNVHADLIKRYAEIQASGELDAGYFVCQYNEIGFWSNVGSPSWYAKTQYRIVEGPNHPSKRHDAMKAEWEAVKDKGTHEIFAKPRSSNADWELLEFPHFVVDYDYEIRPINKPKLNLIDKTKLPIGTMTNFGRLMLIVEDRFHFWPVGDVISGLAASSIRIAPMTEWLSWQGGARPVPEGVIVEIKFRNGTGVSVGVEFVNWGHFKDGFGDIVAYRIVGIADGWTDDPALAS